MAKSQEELKREEKLEEMARHAEMSKLSNGEDWDYKIMKIRLGSTTLRLG